MRADEQLGALRFDKDLREVIAFLADQAPWGVRDKFARLQQIAYVLNADEGNEVCLTVRHALTLDRGP